MKDCLFRLLRLRAVQISLLFLLQQPNQGRKRPLLNVCEKLRSPAEAAARRWRRGKIGKRIIIGEGRCGFKFLAYLPWLAVARNLRSDTSLLIQKAPARR